MGAVTYYGKLHASWQSELSQSRRASGKLPHGIVNFDRRRFLDSNLSLKNLRGKALFT